MYKMICLDLDGTLLTSEKTIDDLTLNLLNELSDQGIYIVIATGRHYDFAKQLTDKLTNDRIIISNNGAAVFDVKTNKAIFANYIDDSIAMQIADIGDRFDLSALIYVDVLSVGSDLFVFEGQNIEGFENTIVRNLNRIKIIKSKNEIYKCLSIVFSDNVEKLEELEKNINFNFNDLVSTHIMSSMYTKHGILEIMNYGVDKWSAIKHYADYNSIEPESIIVFGDEVNDMSMVQNAGLGIAMNNAHPELKNSADLVTESGNDDFGIYKTLVKLFSQKELI